MTPSVRSPTCGGRVVQRTRFPRGRYELPHPHRRSHSHNSGWSYALSACNVPGRRRRGPSRDRTAGIAMTRAFNARESWTLAAETATDRAIPARSDKICCLDPGLPRSVGFGPVRSPLFRPDTRCAGHHSRPVDQALATQLIEHRPMQPTPHPGLGPHREPAMHRGHAHPERGWQHPPCTTAGQHIHHSCEHRPLVGRDHPATLRTRRKLRQRRLHQFPQLVRHQPL